MILLSGYLSSLSALLLLHGYHSQPDLLLLPLDCWHGSSCLCFYSLLSAYASIVYSPSAASSWSTIPLSAALPLHWHLFIFWNRLSSRTFSPLTGLPFIAHQYGQLILILQICPQSFFRLPYLKLLFLRRNTLYHVNLFISFIAFITM